MNVTRYLYYSLVDKPLSSIKGGKWSELERSSVIESTPEIVYAWELETFMWIDSYH
jgi:hypothetical protein